nr:hypothetical protein [Endozoicomonas sp.]
MHVNNYDMSSSGLNIELSCFRDCDLARWKFSNSFAYNKRYDQWVFLDCGNVNVEGFEKTFKVICSTRELFKLYFEFVVNESLSVARIHDVTGFLRELNAHGADLPLRTCPVQSLLKAINSHSDDHKVYAEFLEQHFEPEFFEVVTRGYSQGDYARVIIPGKVLLDFGMAPTQEKADGLEPEIHHLFWDVPLDCRIEIDGDEFDLTEYMDDPYDYNKADMTRLVEAHLLGQFPKTMQRTIRKFLEDHLPEHPGHV